MENLIVPSNVRSIQIADHAANPVNIVWYSKLPNDESSERPPPFPFQVYITNRAAEVALDVEFPTAFACWVEERGGVSSRTQNEACNYRFDIYTTALPNILSCIAHQRKEIDHRNRNCIVPRLVSSWSRNTGLEGYKGRIIVVDDKDWKASGLTFVSFDPAGWPGYSSPADYHNLLRRKTEPPLVWTENSTIQFSRTDHLHVWWYEAGGIWTQEDLMRKNDAGSRYASPAIYPALDPDAHADMEEDQRPEYGSMTLSANAGDGSGAIGANHESTWLDFFDQSNLFMTGEALNGLESQAYRDLLDLPVTSVWDPSASRLRPNFSITLYTAFDMLPVHPKAFFHCLNKGMIASEPWTLDVIENLPSLDSAYQYHAHASKWRSLAHTKRRRSCVRMILRKAIGHKLPKELVDAMEHILVPPHVPNYCRLSLRPFKNVFMYLDASKLSTGPLLVYSDPETLYADELRRAGSLTQMHNPIPSLSPHFHQKFDYGSVQVTWLRFWHRVSDEIHTLWSGCSLSSAGYNANAPPLLTLEIQLSKFFVHPDMPWHRNSLAGVSATLHAEEPIVVHKAKTLSHLLYGEALYLVDLDTGQPMWVRSRHHVSSAYLSDLGWHLTHDPGFCKEGTEPLRVPSSRTTFLEPFEPGESRDITPENWVGWWWSQKDIIKDGGRYALRLRSNVTVPMWTYGTPETLKGPFNLPPIPVVLERPCEFVARYTWSDGYDKCLELAPL